MTEYKVKLSAPQHEQDRCIVYQILEQLKEQRVPPSAMALLTRILVEAEEELQSERSN